MRGALREGRGADLRAEDDELEGLGGGVVRGLEAVELRDDLELERVRQEVRVREAEPVRLLRRALGAFSYGPI